MTGLGQFNQLQIGNLDFTNNMQAVIFKLNRSKPIILPFQLLQISQLRLEQLFVQLKLWNLI